MKSLNELLEANKKWASGITDQKDDFFSELAKGQAPHFLWIGCADSRVPASQVCGAEPGNMFVHRNIANLVVKDDLNILSVIQYAVDALQVKEIIICGHYGCGGVQAALDDKPLGLIDGWLANIKETIKEKTDELDAVEDKTSRMVELNVEKQVENISLTETVQEAWKRGQDLTVHGLFYDLKTGLLKDLEVSRNS
jgi:carbonic anhydrase